MTVCLREIPELTYTYYDEDNHGESVLHEELMKLFRRTRVWQSETDNEAEALWMKFPKEGVAWIKNIIYGLNDVVANGWAIPNGSA